MLILRVLFIVNSSTMFQFTGRRRRRFITLVNRGLERVLAVNTPIEGRVEQQQEQAEVSLEEQTSRIRQLRAILAAIPNGIARRVVDNQTVARIRELLQGVRLDSLPDDIINMINEIF